MTIAKCALALFTAITLMPVGALHAHAAETITMKEAVTIAETFIAENGYTKLPESRVKRLLDNESIEWTADRKQLLAQRRNTLSAEAIGAKRGRRNDPAGWSVAFDYTNQQGNSDNCRVVTMTASGREVRIEHVDGIRSYFQGFKKP